MQPGTYNIEIHQGDTYYGPLITLPDLSVFGGPSTLAGATVTARVSRAGTRYSMSVTIVDAGARKLRLTIDATTTETMPAGTGTWDLEVVNSGATWVGTLLAGEAAVTAQVLES